MKPISDDFPLNLGFELISLLHIFTRIEVTQKHLHHEKEPTIWGSIFLKTALMVSAELFLLQALATFRIMAALQDDLQVAVI